MKYLIDTHILLWFCSDYQLLSQRIRRILLNRKNSLFVSLASIWEIAIKSSLGKLTLSVTIDQFVRTQIIKNDINILEIKLEDLYLVEKLPFHHRDPFDRLIIAQALNEGIDLISMDPVFKKYNV